MLKFLGVVGLWGALIAAPHMGPSVIDVNAATAAPRITIPDEDPGDPPPTPAPAAVKREPAGSFATIHFKNDLGKTLTLVEADVTLDGKAVPMVAPPRAGEDLVVFSGRVDPGVHPVTTRIVCRGNSRGPFTYVKKYELTAHSDAAVTVPRERAVIFTIAATRRKGMTVPFEQQLAVSVHDEVIPESN
jgi:hypothetical protein